MPRVGVIDTLLGRGTVAATRFIASTDRDTLEAIARRTARAALAHGGQTEDTDQQNEQEDLR